MTRTTVVKHAGATVRERKVIKRECDIGKRRQSRRGAGKHVRALVERRRGWRQKERPKNEMIRNAGSEETEGESH